MRKFFLAFGIVAALLVVPVGFLAINWLGKAASVAYEQIDPRRLLREYENFKDIHAQLAQKKVSIEALQGNIDALVADFEGVARSEWPRDDRQALRQFRQERAGLVLNFNSLAADYNARMAKINYRFCNVGDLPQGATEPLPREYVLYMDN